MSKNFEIIDFWEDSLLYCPSQCELKIKAYGRNYILYLRWRWDDPWTADLIPVDNQFSDDSKFSNDWVELNIPYFTNEQLNECKEAAIKVVKDVLDGKE